MDNINKPVIISRIDTYDKLICDKLKYLSYNKFNEYMSKVNSDERETDENNAKIWEFKEFEKIKNIINDAIKNNYSVKQNYSYAEGTSDGRLFLNNKNGGLQNINRFFRGVLSYENYVDVDMINCHANILRGLCYIHKIDCYHLTDYCINRKTRLNELIKLGVKKEHAKKLFIISMNSSNSIDKYKINKKKNIEFNDEHFFKKFDEEMKVIQNKIYDLEIYKNNIKSIKERKGISNIKGKLLNSLLCVIENDIIKQVIKYGFKVDVPMFDGFMTTEDISNRKEYLGKLNNIEICKKYFIKWDFKEHELNLYDEILKIECNNKVIYYGDNIIDLANKILDNDFKDKIFRHNGQIYYKTQKKWICGIMKDIEPDIFTWVTSQDLYLKKNKKESTYELLNDSINNPKSLVYAILKLVPNNDIILNEIWKKSLFKIVFNNGCYDFKNKKFETNFDKIDTFYNISHDLNLNSSSKIRKEIYKVILNPIFSIDNEQEDIIQVKVRDFFLYKMARTMAGHIEDKLFFLMTGNRDCGKGVLTDFLKKCFQGYILAIESNCLLYKKTMGDMAKNNSWIMDCEFSRLALAQEIKLDDREYIDGNLIKKFCSGGDYISARKNHKDEREFQLQSSLMICCNDIPIIAPNDAIEKAVIFDMKSKFIDDNYDDNLKLSNIKYYKKIENIKSEYLNNKDFINEFILIILEYYDKKCKMPQEELENIKNDYTIDEDTKKIKELFIQGNQEDKISYTILKNIIKDNNLNMSINKLNKLIKGCFKSCILKSNGTKYITGVLYKKPFEY